jgi:hypothetical protein
MPQSTSSAILRISLPVVLYCYTERPIVPAAAAEQPAASSELQEPERLNP